jgi:hypothetical protein
MSGSDALRDASAPESSRIVLRALLITMAMLLLTLPFSSTIVASLLPYLRFEFSVLHPDSVVREFDVVRADSGDVVRLRAFERSSRIAYSSQSGASGTVRRRPDGYQIETNALGILQSGLVFLIAILSWPGHGRPQWRRRLLLAPVFLSALISIDAPLDLLGNYQHALSRSTNASADSPWFIWAKFLEGGGNNALALLFAAITIRIAASGQHALRAP